MKNCVTLYNLEKISTYPFRATVVDSYQHEGSPQCELIHPAVVSSVLILEEQSVK